MTHEEEMQEQDRLSEYLDQVSKELDDATTSMRYSINQEKSIYFKIIAEFSNIDLINNLIKEAMQ